MFFFPIKVYVAQLANHFLKQNKTEEEILGELKLVCNFFPNDLKDQVIFKNLKLTNFKIIDYLSEIDNRVIISGS